MIAKSYYGLNSDFTNVIKADEYIIRLFII